MRDSVPGFVDVGSLRRSRPQLNTTQQRYNPDFYAALEKIMQLRKKYHEERVLFVEGAEMTGIVKRLGATDEDLAAIQQVSDNLKGDPTLPYRHTRNGRFCFDFDTFSVRRLEFQPFILSVAEDFKRYDSGKVRSFDEVEDELQLNTAFQALMVFKALMFHDMDIKHRPHFDYTGNKWVLTLFSVRTITTPEILGEPALEGVHTDGVDHTMTTYLGAKNMKPESAVTFLHGLEETIGKSYNQTKPEHLKGRVHHRHFLDTALIVDSERKHSLSPVFPDDETKEAKRDMLVFFTRRPVTKDHISAPYDSLSPHQEMPMEIPLVSTEQRGAQQVPAHVKLS